MSKRSRMVVWLGCWCLPISALFAKESPEEGVWIKLLFSEVSSEADQAAIHLFTDADLSWGSLIQHSQSSAGYRGTFLWHPAMSVLRDRPPEAGMVCIYLIEAIRRGDLFFGYDYYPSGNGTGRGEPDEKMRHEAAMAAYKHWWDQVQTLVGDERNRYLRDVDPLEGTGLSWQPSSGRWRKKRK